MKNFIQILFFTVFSFLSIDSFANSIKDPLPSWNDGPNKQRIIDFVGNITDPDNPQFVPTKNRIASIDNNDTLPVKHYQPLLEVMRYLQDHQFSIYIGSDNNQKLIHAKQKPVITFGNSDGDREMLELTQSTKGQHLMFLVRTKTGALSDSLINEALNEHWGIISMQNDWKAQFLQPEP